MFRVLELYGLDLMPEQGPSLIAKRSFKQHKFSPGSLDVLNKGWA